MYNITQTIKVLVLALVLSFGLSYVYAWTAPTATPPGGNTAAPINTGSTNQIKIGGLTMDVATSTVYKDANDPNFWLNPNGDSVLQNLFSRGDVCSGFGTASQKCLSAVGGGGVTSVNGQTGDVVVAPAASGFVADGYVPIPVNATEDVYNAFAPAGSSLSGFTADTCNGDPLSVYQCGSSEDLKICTDTAPSSIPYTVCVGCGSDGAVSYPVVQDFKRRQVACNRALAYVKSVAPTVLSVTGLSAPGSTDVGYSTPNTCGQGGSYPLQSIPSLTVKGPSSTYAGGTVIKENRSVVVEMSATLDYGFNLWISKNGGPYQIMTSLYHPAAGQGSMSDLVTYNLNLGASEYARFAHSAGECWQNWYHSGSFKLTFPMQ